MTKLTRKQLAFCHEYIIDLNATQAAIRVGYSKKAATKISCELLAKPDVRGYVDNLMEERAKRTQINADYVLRQAVKLHERCMQEISPVLDLKGQHVKDENGNLLYKFDSKGAAAGLKMVGNHINVNAFSRKTINEHEDDNEEVTLNISAAVSIDEAADIYKKLMR